MAIPFALPSEDEAEAQGQQLEQLMLDLYAVLQQVLRSRSAQHPSRNHRLPRRTSELTGSREHGSVILVDTDLSRLPLPDLVLSAVEQLPSEPPLVTASAPSSPTRDATFQFPECSTNARNEIRENKEKMGRNCCYPNQRNSCPNNNSQCCLSSNSNSCPISPSSSCSLDSLNANCSQKNLNGNCCSNSPNSNSCLNNPMSHRRPNDVNTNASPSIANGNSSPHIASSNFSPNNASDNSSLDNANTNCCPHNASTNCCPHNASTNCCPHNANTNCCPNNSSSNCFPNTSERNYFSDIGRNSSFSSSSDSFSTSHIASSNCCTNITMNCVHTNNSNCTRSRSSMTAANVSKSNESCENISSYIQDQDLHPRCYSMNKSRSSFGRSNSKFNNCLSRYINKNLNAISNRNFSNNSRSNLRSNFRSNLIKCLSSSLPNNLPNIPASCMSSNLMKKGSRKKIIDCCEVGRGVGTVDIRIEIPLSSPAGRPRARRRMMTETAMEKSLTKTPISSKNNCCRHLMQALNERQWASVGANLRNIADDFHASKTKSTEIEKSRLPLIDTDFSGNGGSASSSTDSLLSLLIPAPLRETLWTTVALYLGWRLVSRLR